MEDDIQRLEIKNCAIMGAQVAAIGGDMIGHLAIDGCVIGGSPSVVKANSVASLKVTRSEIETAPARPAPRKSPTKYFAGYSFGKGDDKPD